MDAYKVLNIPPNASPAAIKARSGKNLKKYFVQETDHEISWCSLPDQIKTELRTRVRNRVLQLRSYTNASTWPSHVRLEARRRIDGTS